MTKDNLTGFEKKVYNQYKKLGSKLLQTVTEKEEDERINLTKHHSFDYTYTEPDQADARLIPFLFFL